MGKRVSDVCWMKSNAAAEFIVRLLTILVLLQNEKASLHPFLEPTVAYRPILALFLARDIQPVGL